MADMDARFRWDRDEQLLIYDGSNDPDPDWKWVPERGGYVPVNSAEKIWDIHRAMWVFTPAQVN